jgi:hypothetical protein
MSSASNPDVVNLFKKVYGDLQHLLPEDYPLQRDIPFSEKQKVGEKYVEAVCLTNESGWTLGGSTMTAFELNPAIAGSVQQAEVTPYSTVLASLVPWGVISRTAGGGEKAFFDATKYVVKNNLRSHGKLLEVIRLYGQASGLLGYVSYYSGLYRGQSFTNGTGTVGGIAFTNGINAASKAILFNKGTFAAGIWVGSEGAMIQEVNASNVVVQEGTLVSVDPLNGIITTSFTPTAASSLTSHRICFKGQANAQEAVGIVNILSNTSTLFGIPTSAYSLWKGNAIDNLGQKFTLQNIQEGVAQAVARGALDGDLLVYVNPRTWSRMVTTEAGLRVYDSTYKPGEAENGFESITFYHQTGKAVIKAHRMIKEGEALGLHVEDWSRSGSAEISFQVPGINKEIIFPVENMAAYAFRSYSDQYVFCHAPAKSIYWYNIDDEAA